MVDESLTSWARVSFSIELSSQQIQNRKLHKVAFDKGSHNSVSACKESFDFFPLKTIIHTNYYKLFLKYWNFDEKHVPINRYALRQW